MNELEGSVGAGGANRRGDVSAVQAALNSFPADQGGPEEKLDEDGDCGALTVAAIRRFQEHHFGSADSRIDAGGRTFRRLSQGPGDAPTGAAAGALADPLDGPAAIDAWFAAAGAGGSGFLDWFRATQAGRGAWANVGVHAEQADFARLWASADVIYGRTQVSPAEVLVLMSIVMNETGGTIRPITEKVGRDGHPGIAYAFDSISGLKRSYNVEPWTAFACFNDPHFIAAHQAKPLGAELVNTHDAAWKGTAYPQDRYSTSTDPAKTGFVQEADFYKFRGRGLIQTTGRGNYRRLIDWIQGYDGPQPVLQKYRELWQGKGVDAVACASSNRDWDELFQQTEHVLAARAIGIHNESGGGYLAVSGDKAELLGEGGRSAYRAGKVVSGGQAYAKKFQGRVTQMVTSLGV